MLPRRPLASGYGLDLAPERRLAVMGVPTAANQFGYLDGSAVGGLALVVGGCPLLGMAFAALSGAAGVLLARLRATV